MAFSSYIVDMVDLVNHHVNVLVENVVGSRNIAEKISTLVKNCDQFEEMQNIAKVHGGKS